MALFMQPVPPSPAPFMMNPTVGALQPFGRSNCVCNKVAVHCPVTSQMSVCLSSQATVGRRRFFDGAALFQHPGQTKASQKRSANKHSNNISQKTCTCSWIPRNDGPGNESAPSTYFHYWKHCTQKPPPSLLHVRGFGS